jgi:hypothetical protein
VKRRQCFLLLSPLLVIGATAVLKSDTPWMRDARLWLDRCNESQEQKAWRHAGIGAVDCGELYVTALVPSSDQKFEAVDGCVLRNFKKGKAFRVRYIYNCTDGCRDIRAWNPQHGLLVQRENDGKPANSKMCADAAFVEEEADFSNGLPNGRRGTHTTVGCP